MGQIKHRHRFKRFSYSGIEITEKCKCGEERRRPTTDKDRKEYEEKHDKDLALHALWHKFAQTFMSDTYQISFDDTGFELMEKIDKCVEEHPEIKTTGCDDTHFSSSDLVFIPHENDEEYMGTTMIYVPQMGGPPSIAFLYPGHVEGLIETLKHFKKKAGTKPSALAKILRKIKRNKKI